jgi:hypothetical protein
MLQFILWSIEKLSATLCIKMAGYCKFTEKSLKKDVDFIH